MAACVGGFFRAPISLIEEPERSELDSLFPFLDKAGPEKSDPHESERKGRRTWKTLGDN